MLSGNSPSPALVSPAAVRALPRWALYLLCTVYVLAGYVARDPWKNADLTTLVTTLELAGASGAANWWQPAIMGQVSEPLAWLPYWLGAWLLELNRGLLPPEIVVRAPFALMLAGVLAATWHAVYYLARHPGAAPVALAFGGEIRITDYARALADGGLLALIATLGLAQFSHEAAPALAQLFFVATAFYGLAAMPFRPRAAPLVTLTATLGLSISGAPALALVYSLCFAWSLFIPRTGHMERDARSRARLCAALAALLCAMLWLVYWRLGWQPPGLRLQADGWRSLAQLLLWFTWPVWAFALWTLWRWRYQLRQLGRNRHLALPLLMAGLPLLDTALSRVGDRALLLALPGLAALAAFALPTFKRGASALVDWFSVLFFSAWIIGIWVVWISLQTGIPAKPAANVARLAPGFALPLHWPALFLAMAGTAGWIVLARWRTARHRPALWKSLVLPAAGAATCWLLLMTLWLPGLNYGRSMAPQIRDIQAVIGATDCVQVLHLSPVQIAAARFHGGWETRPYDSTPGCRWLLTDESPDDAPARTQPDARHWEHVESVARPTNRREVMGIYRRLDR